MLKADGVRHARATGIAGARTPRLNHALARLVTEMKAMLGLVVLIVILVSVYLAWVYHASSQRLQPAEYRCKPEGGPPWAILHGEAAKDLAQLWCAGAPGEPRAYWSPSSQ